MGITECDYIRRVLTTADQIKAKFETPADLCLRFSVFVFVSETNRDREHPLQANG